VAQRLRERGFSEAYALRGGWDGWLESGGPTEERDLNAEGEACSSST
jgi:rhodanese-related sulfurtransferase